MVDTTSCFVAGYRTLLCARQDHSSASSGLCTTRASSSAAMPPKCREQSSHGKKFSMKPLSKCDDGQALLMCNSTTMGPRITRSHLAMPSGDTQQQRFSLDGSHPEGAARVSCHVGRQRVEQQPQPACVAPRPRRAASAAAPRLQQSGHWQFREKFDIAHRNAGSVMFNQQFCWQFGQCARSPPALRTFCRICAPWQRRRPWAAGWRPATPSPGSPLPPQLRHGTCAFRVRQ